MPACGNDEGRGVERWINPKLQSQANPDLRVLLSPPPRRRTGEFEKKTEDEGLPVY